MAATGTPTTPTPASECLADANAVCARCGVLDCCENGPFCCSRERCAMAGDSRGTDPWRLGSVWLHARSWARDACAPTPRFDWMALESPTASCSFGPGGSRKVVCQRGRKRLEWPQLASPREGLDAGANRSHDASMQGVKRDGALAGTPRRRRKLAHSFPLAGCSECAQMCPSRKTTQPGARCCQRI